MSKDETQSTGHSLLVQGLADQLRGIPVAPCPAERLYDRPLRVCVTGAAGQISYSLLWQILRGAAFGKAQTLDLRLLEIPPVLKALKGVCMEIKDSACPLIRRITPTADAREAFANCEVALLVGARPRSKGMLRADLLRANAAIFKSQGEVLDEVAAQDCKILVVGNPANTNAMVAAHVSKRLCKRNFTAMTRLDQSRAVSQVAEHLGVKSCQVRNVIIWGNHSATQVPDISSAVIANHPIAGQDTPAARAINDSVWLSDTFIPAVQQRGAAIIEARGLSSAASAAAAVCDHMHDWLLGSAPGTVVSMGVYSQGEYGVPEGLIFSMPCVCKRGGTIEIVKDLPLSKDTQQRIERSRDELLAERTSALSLFADTS